MTCSPRAGDESDAAVRLQRNPSVELTFFRRLADTDDDRGLTLANVSLHTTQVSPAQGPSTDDESIPLDTELRLGQRPILSSTGRQHQKGHPTEQNSFLNGFRVNSNNYHGYSKETRVQSTTRPSPSPKGGRELYRPSDVRNVTDIKTSFSSSEPFLPFLDTAKPPRDWARTLSISWGIGFFFFSFFLLLDVRAAAAITRVPSHLSLLQLPRDSPPSILSSPDLGFHTEREIFHTRLRQQSRGGHR